MSIYNLLAGYSPGTGIVSGFVLVGSLNSSPAGGWQLDITSDGAMFAMAQSAEPGGTGTIYYSADLGANWTQRGSMVGTGSAYGFGLLAISSSIVIAQHRGSMFRSTNGGVTFSSILNTSGGQNNFFRPTTDGTYGVCGGYDQNMVTSNNWVSASAAGLPFGRCMATVTVTNNGSNRFLHAGLGSSSSPAAAYIATNVGGSAVGPISVTGNQNYVASNPVTGFNAIVSAPEGSATFGVLYATYPGTSYSNANVTGMGTLRTGQPCISPGGTIIVPMTTGVWSVNTSGSAPTLISGVTNIRDARSDGENYVYLIGADGQVYRWAP
jgi:hypothetical protein